MGKSDPIIFRWYLTHMNLRPIDSIAFLGFTGENDFTREIPARERDFYDLQLENWNINDNVWSIDKKYDVVVCTRCAYFAKDPNKFLENCLSLLNKGGKLIVDWSLGDSWRFENFKIGWVKDGEHEFCYGEDNLLWSAVWSDIFQEHTEFKKFENWVEKFGYDDVKKAIFDEVPSILKIENVVGLFKSVTCDIITLWEDSPQMYVLLSCIK